MNCHYNLWIFILVGSDLDNTCFQISLRSLKQLSNNKQYHTIMLITNDQIYSSGGIQSQPSDQSEYVDPKHPLRTENLINLSYFAHASIFKGVIYPWEILPNIAEYIHRYLSLHPEEKKQSITTIGSVFIDEDVIIGEGTTIQHGAMIKGPTIIGKNCQIRKGAYFRGNVIIGDNCIIGNSTELKNCVVLNKAQICHFNYVGDSIIGEGAHLAAGAITSNLKLDQTLVIVRYKESHLETGLKKFGTIVGDYCQVGCNVVLNPGSILGKRCVVYPGTCLRGVIPQNHIVKLIQESLIVHKA